MAKTDFLNPKSMLTPGIAGSCVAMISNTLWLQFALPPKWTALSLSYLILLPILSQFTASIWQKCLYFILNGLIIFSMAVGINTSGSFINTQRAQPSVESKRYFYMKSDDSSQSRDFFTDWFKR